MQQKVEMQVEKSTGQPDLQLILLGFALLYPTYMLHAGRCGHY